MPSETADIVIVGAGAAGLVAAIMAGRSNPSGLKIWLLDSRQKVGAKILMSGGGRCNVTNERVSVSDYEGGPRHFIKHVLNAFTPADTLKFFEAIGVKLSLEPGGKYFPATYSGKTVLEALLKEAGRHRIDLKPGVKITKIEKKKDLFCMKGRLTSEKNRPCEFFARRVLLATGGLSYPETGSDGTGLSVAETLGHTQVRTSPALTPLTTENKDWGALSGITLDVKLSFYKSDKKAAEAEGSFLFTHVGFSGPAALDISRHFARAEKQELPKIVASFLPKQTEESLGRRFEQGAKAHPDKLIKSFLAAELSLPGRFIALLFNKIEMDEKNTLAKCPRARRQRLIHGLLNCDLEVSGVAGYEKAEVTAGGVDLGEVNFSTMESKRVPGLFFAGEILDVDGRIGGYNFQWAWSSGAVAGRSAVKSLQKDSK